MRELLRTIRNPQTAEYLSEVIDAVVPLEDDVGNNDDEPETEIQHHICMFPNGDKYDGGFLVQRFRSHGSTDFRLERREGNGTYTEADGSRYEGEWKSGLRHGKGTQWWASSGDEYQGEWKQDRRHGRGRQVCTDGRVYAGGWVADRQEGTGHQIDSENTAYKGHFKQGLAHGTGVKVWPTGQRYHGELQQGMEHGRGLLSYPDGSFYKGEFVQGKMHGRGVLEAHGVRYEGEFVDNMQHGKGSQWQLDDASEGREGGSAREGGERGRAVAPERGEGGGMDPTDGETEVGGNDVKQVRGGDGGGGGRYDGEFVKGMKEGFGVYRWGDGLKYEGEYKSDVKCGTGLLRWPDGQVYRGMFAAGKRHGIGRTTWPNGDVFEGLYEDGLKHGVGSFEAANGDVHKGLYHKDCPHGQGRFISNDGDSFEGTWEHGARHGTGVEMRSGCRTRTCYRLGDLLSVTPIDPGPERPEGRPHPGWRYASFAKEAVAQRVQLSAPTHGSNA